MLYEFVSVSAVSWFSFLSAARRSASFRTSVSSTDMSNADAMVRINWGKLTERLFPDLDVDHEPFDAGAYRKEQWKSPEHAKISKPGHYLPSLARTASRWWVWSSDARKRTALQRMRNTFRMCSATMI